MGTKRSNWSNYFMQIAHAVSSRGTCDRKKVGCVLVVERRIVATGYNGSAPGMPHCDDVGHDIVESTQDGKTVRNCVRTIHAEANAIAQAARFGVPLRGCEAFVNTYPCWPCFRLLASVGVVRVWFDDEYRIDARVIECADRLGIAVHGPNVWRSEVK